MTISKDLFLAILSMDAYNRGYGAGLADGVNVDSNGDDLDGLGEAGKQIGNATVKAVDLPTGAQAAGFYAIAYEITGAGYADDDPAGDDLTAGDTVISFRGTDSFLPA